MRLRLSRLVFPLLVLALLGGAGLAASAQAGPAGLNERLVSSRAGSDPQPGTERFSKTLV